MIGVGCGVFAFLLYNALHVLLPVGFFFSYFSQSILFYAFLRHGSFCGMLAILSQVILQALFLAPQSMFFFIASQSVPTLTLSFLWQMRKKQSFSPRLGHSLVDMSLLTLVCAVVACAYYLPYDDPIQPFRLFFKDLFQDHFLEQEKILVFFYDLLPGFFGISWIVMNVSNFYVAYRFLHKQDSTNYPISHRVDANFKDGFDIPLVIGLLMILLDVPFFKVLGTTICLISCVPLFAKGWYVSYLFIKQLSFYRFHLFFLGALCFILVWPALFIVVLGILDSWFHYSYQLQNKTANNDG